MDWIFIQRDNGRSILECYQKQMENIKKGLEPLEAIEKASGTYGRFDEAVKLVDPRME